MKKQAIIGLTAIAIIHLLAAVVAFGQQHVPETRLVAVEQRFIQPDPIVRCSLIPGGEPVEFRTRLQRYPDTGTFWRWSPVAHHHRAAVRVIAGNGAGSGVCVATDSGVCVVLTNHHVVDSHRSVIVSWPGGDRAQGQVIAIRHMNQEDVAAIIVQQPAAGWFGLSIASQTPPPGTDVEMLAFGGPQYGRFRSFFATLIRGDSRVSIDAPTISGDSGSGIVWQGQVIGVNYGGPAATSAALSSDGPIPLVYPATSGCNAEFLGRWLTQSCAPWGCRPRIGPITGPQININSPQIPRGDDQFYPPSAGVQPTVPTPIPDPVPNGNYCQPCQPIDVGKLRNEIVADVLSKIPKPRDGADGKDGRDGVDGQNASLSEQQIAQIVAMASEHSRRNLPPIYLRKIGADGKETVEPIYLGEGMTFRMFPHDQQHK